MTQSVVIKDVQTDPIITYQNNSYNFELRKVNKHNARQVEIILTKCNLLKNGKVFPPPSEWHSYFGYSYLVLYATFSVATIVCKKLSDQLIIETIAVLENFRNLGLGKFMLNSLVSSVSNDVRSISAKIDEECDSLYHIYVSCGFEKENDSLIKYLDGTKDDSTAEVS